MPERIPFPSEFVSKLNEHPYVLKATAWSVSFTPEFKQIAYDAYRGGKSMRQIFTDAGFAVEILGTKRLNDFRNDVVARAEKGIGFEDQRKNNCRKQAVSTEAQLEKRIRYLEHRNAYLEQENEFLKKIQSLEKGCGGKTDGAK